jgi:hypothetical protein
VKCRNELLFSVNMHPCSYVLVSILPSVHFSGVYLLPSTSLPSKRTPTPNSLTHPSRTLQKQTKIRTRRDSNAGLSEISSGDRPCIQVDFANLPFAKGNLKSYFVSVVPLDYASCYVILIEDL